LLANKLLGVHAVKRVASKTATPSVVVKAFAVRGFGAGLRSGLETGCWFVDSMFYIIIVLV
jgi:uncharacterized membrane protein